MKIYVVMSAVVLTICSCKPRVDKTALLEDSKKSPEMVTLGGLLKGVTLPAATPGVWAFGKKPESVTKWPSPEGYEQDKYGRLTWPTNWPISPTGAMPYEKLYSHKRNLEGG